ncbi:hypothetical protein G7L40_00515 [Paenibacillus polymyxa]|uniref:Uncharacterized protein n=1 Tax=Paenibacillus polymyxa TaxID=1406 RepID=A0A378XXJ4_PAEPO|nr:hypothetical protein [Paenibacillus polymyxa]MBE7897193.1 hypothetical protein [Paenibacillus polymyxa]MBG9763048.1 hypothetical protein [Paenibacillus polymyxa]MCC3257557.1 hypothetical protein [Paenibacillus polymyxa]QPK51358.1 hypothetical protein G7035_00515 [Paenibacillus polymyxa]QPK56448.1 hypothetical protein G7L40_00515 [Paenibacillus polymyxa]
MELNMDEKVLIKNLCNWDLFIKRILKNGDVKIAANKTVKLTREEIEAQVNNGNNLFTGTDGMGSNPRIYIEDRDLRVHLDFESEDGEVKQEILTAEEIERIINLKTFNSFKDNIEKKVVTENQKHLLLNVSKKNKLNDFEKIKFIEEYTGLKFNKE